MSVSFTFQGFGVPLNLIKKSGLNSRFAILFDISGFTWCASLFARTQPVFLSAQMASFQCL